MKAESPASSPAGAAAPHDLADQLPLLRSVFDGMSDSMIVVDRDGKIVLRNAAAEQLEFDPIVGQADDPAKPGKAFHDDRVTPYDRHELPLLRALRGEIVHGEQLYIVMPTHAFWLNVNASPLLDAAGEITGALAVYRDDTARHDAVDALRESERRFRQLVESSDVVPWEADLAREELTYIGPQIIDLLGYPVDDWKHESFWRQCLDPADRDRVLEYFADARTTGQPTDIEYRLRSATGESVWVRDIAKISHRENGRRIQQGFMFSIVERKKAEVALRNSQRLLQSILDSTPAVIYLKDVEGRYLAVNGSFEDVFGVQREQLSNKTDFDVFSPQMAAGFRENDMRVIASREALQFEEAIPCADRMRYYLSMKHPLFRDDGELYAVCGISTDITDRKNAEEKVLLEQKFLAETLKAHERDRQLLAYEIHDGLVQDIAAGVMHLESVRRAAKDANDQRVEDLNASLMLFRRAIDEARRVLSGLRPPILDESGVVLAIEYLVAEQQSPDLEVTFSSNVSFHRLDSLLEGTIFRIVQEALTNIKRHSHSEEAAVRLTQKGNRLHLLVQDWGVGFDPAAVVDDHFGLHGIRKRAALAGGSAEIISVVGEGTRVIVELPLVESVGGPAK